MIINGLPMLHSQADLSWQLWNNLIWWWVDMKKEWFENVTIWKFESEEHCQK
jgi:hypothetical protein